MKIYLIDNADPHIKIIGQQLADNFQCFAADVFVKREELSEYNQNIDQVIDTIKKFDCRNDFIFLKYSATAPVEFVEKHAQQFSKSDFFVIDLCLTIEEEAQYRVGENSNPLVQELSGHKLADSLGEYGIPATRTILISKIVEDCLQTEHYGNIISKPFLRLRDNPVLRPGNVSVRGIGMPKCLGVANYVLDFCYKIYSKAFCLI